MVLIKPSYALPQDQSNSIFVPICHLNVKIMLHFYSEAVLWGMANQNVVCLISSPDSITCLWGPCGRQQLYKVSYRPQDVLFSLYNLCWGILASCPPASPWVLKQVMSAFAESPRTFTRKCGQFNAPQNESWSFGRWELAVKFFSVPLT